MIRATGNRRAFTLLELLVVVGMIALIMGAMSTAVTSAQERARVQKATAEVKVITQAILAYEDWSREGLKELDNEPADSKSLGFLFGQDGSSRSGQPFPTLVMASLRNGGKLLNPWGNPYKVKIKKNGARLNQNFSTINAGYYVPNIFRVTDAERQVIMSQGN